MAELIVTYNPYLSSPASKFAYAANEFNQVKASRDGFVSGGSGLGGWVGQDNAHGQGMADVRIVGVTGMFSGFPHMTKPRGTPEALPKFYWAVILQQMRGFFCCARHCIDSLCA